MVGYELHITKGGDVLWCARAPCPQKQSRDCLETRAPPACRIEGPWPNQGCEYSQVNVHREDGRFCLGLAIFCSFCSWQKKCEFNGQERGGTETFCFCFCENPLYLVAYTKLSSANAIIKTQLITKKPWRFYHFNSAVVRPATLVVLANSLHRRPWEPNLQWTLLGHEHFPKSMSGK